MPLEMALLLSCPSFSSLRFSCAHHILPLSQRPKRFRGSFASSSSSSSNSTFFLLPLPLAAKVFNTTQTFPAPGPKEGGGDNRQPPPHNGLGRVSRSCTRDSEEINLRPLVLERSRRRAISVAVRESFFSLSLFFANENTTHSAHRLWFGGFRERQGCHLNAPLPSFFQYPD